MRQGGEELVTRAAQLLDSEPWGGVAPRARTLLAGALGPEGGEEQLASAGPERPSAAVGLAGNRDPVELVLARALGAEWLDSYLTEWRAVELDIDGEDLIAAGVSPGPALGAGLHEALRAKLDGEVSGRDAELTVALRAAKENDGMA